MPLLSTESTLRSMILLPASEQLKYLARKFCSTMELMELFGNMEENLSSLRFLEETVLNPIAKFTASENTRVSSPETARPAASVAPRDATRPCSFPGPALLAMQYATELLCVTQSIAREMREASLPFRAMPLEFKEFVLSVPQHLERLVKGRHHRDRTIQYECTVNALLSVAGTQPLIGLHGSMDLASTITLDTEHERLQSLAQLIMEVAPPDPAVSSVDRCRAFMERVPSMMDLLRLDCFMLATCLVHTDAPSLYSHDPWLICVEKLPPTLRYVGCAEMNTQTVKAIQRDNASRGGSLSGALSTAHSFSSARTRGHHHYTNTREYHVLMLPITTNAKLAGSQVFIDLTSLCLSGARVDVPITLTTQIPKYPDAPIASIAAVLRFYLLKLEDRTTANPAGAAPGGGVDGSKNEALPAPIGHHVLLAHTQRLPEFARGYLSTAVHAFEQRFKWNNYVRTLASANFEEALTTSHTRKRTEGLHTSDPMQALMAIMVSLEEGSNISEPGSALPGRVVWTGQMLWERLFALLTFFYRSLPYRTEMDSNLLSAFNINKAGEQADGSAPSLLSPATSKGKKERDDKKRPRMITLGNYVCPVHGCRPYRKHGWTPEAIVFAMGTIANTYGLVVPPLNPIQVLIRHNNVAPKLHFMSKHDAIVRSTCAEPNEKYEDMRKLVFHLPRHFFSLVPRDETTGYPVDAEMWNRQHQRHSTALKKPGH